MLGVPYMAKAMGLSDEVAGGWIGTGIDNTGNVVVSGAIFSDDAETIASVAKIIQTTALGPICLIVAYYWNTVIEKGEDKKGPSLWLIYDKFPKFVLGFLIVSTTNTNPNSFITSITRSLTVPIKRIPFNSNDLGKKIFPTKNTSHLI